MGVTCCEAIISVVTQFLSFAVFLQHQSIDPLLRVSMGDFLSTITDEDLNVRRVALVAFNSAAHNKPTLIRDLLTQVLPHLYTETKVRVSLNVYDLNLAACLFFFS